MSRRSQRWSLGRARRRERRGSAVNARVAEPRYTIVPPEGVPLTFDLAGVGARLGAQFVDLLVTLVAAVALFLFLAAYVPLAAQVLLTLIGLLLFLIRTPYYVASELAWNGRTLSKRWLGLRSISRDGRPLRAYQIVVRNLMREIEFFTPILYLLAGSNVERTIASVWTIVVVVVPWRSKENRRLGDIVAGTLVIREPKAVLPGDVSDTPEEERFTFTTAQLDAYGAYELQVLERLLRPPTGKPNAAAQRQRETTLAEVVTRIRNRIGYADPVDPRENETFLRAFYRAQRAYLESRKLFGDAREDKRYREREEG